MHFKLKEIILEVAKENNISFEQAKQIFDSEFLCTKEIMKEGEHNKPETFKNINIINLGKIYCKTKIVENMRDNQKKKKDD